MKHSYKDHLKKGADLVTTYEETRAGFIALALEKNRLATPYVEQARALKVSAQKAKTPKDLLNIKEIEMALLSASGISDKASKFMENQDKKTAILGLIENFLEPAGENFIDELVYRYLLTKGDALGGSMRNVGGILAQRKLARLIISYLELQKIPYFWKDSKTNSWVEGKESDPDIELSLKGISWVNGKSKRTILYNVTVPVVKNNIDLCLFNKSYDEVGNSIDDPKSYIALGELKGGIDPAGADEHWKTANSALDRIRESFALEDCYPKTFFIGAAIASRMAEEIWNDLNKDTLSNAANLTNPDQVNSLAQWLCNI